MALTDIVFDEVSLENQMMVTPEARFHSQSSYGGFTKVRLLGSQ